MAHTLLSRVCSILPSETSRILKTDLMSPNRENVAVVYCLISVRVRLLMHGFARQYLNVVQVDYIKGFGKLGGPNTVNVDLTEGGKQSLETKNIVIATGSEVTPLPPVPVDNAQGKIVDSTGALDLKEVIFDMPP